MDEERDRLNLLLSEVRIAWAACGSALLGDDDDWYYQTITGNFTASLEKAYRVGWDLALQRVALSELARDRSILNGPLYTTNKYPWPIDGEKFMLPIVQLDLAEVSALSGINLGSGLVQLWQSGVEMHTRIIPDRDVCPASSDIPTFIPNVNMEGFHFKIGSSGVPPFIADCHHVVGYKGPYIFGPTNLDDFLERFILSARCTTSLRSSFKALKRTVDEGRKSFRQSNRVFGSFDPINEQPEDRPPALFSSDDDTILNTGDAGTIALYYEQACAGAKFSGSFDCY